MMLLRAADNDTTWFRRGEKLDCFIRLFIKQELAAFFFFCFPLSEANLNQRGQELTQATHLGVFDNPRKQLLN